MTSDNTTNDLPYTDDQVETLVTLKVGDRRDGSRSVYNAYLTAHKCLRILYGMDESALPQPAAMVATELRCNGVTLDLEAMKKPYDESIKYSDKGNEYSYGYNQSIDDMKAKGFIRSDDAVRELVEVLKTCEKFMILQCDDCYDSELREKIDAALAKHGDTK